MQVKKIKPCTMRRNIKVGERVPNQVHFRFDRGGGSTNMASWYMDMLFKKELAKLQKKEYVFSEICRNNNEKKAFYAAIKFNLLKMGYKVKFIK